MPFCPDPRSLGDKIELTVNELQTWRTRKGSIKCKKYPIQFPKSIEQRKENCTDFTDLYLGKDSRSHQKKVSLINHNLTAAVEKLSGQGDTYQVRIKQPQHKQKGQDLLNLLDSKAQFLICVKQRL